MMTSKQERIMRMRYTMICGLLPIKDDKKKLAAAIRRTAEEYSVSILSSVRLFEPALCRLFEADFATK